MSGTLGELHAPGQRALRRAQPRRELQVFYRDGLAVLNQKPLPEIVLRGLLCRVPAGDARVEGNGIAKVLCCGPDLIHDLHAAGLIVMERERLAQKAAGITFVLARQHRAVSHQPGAGPRSTKN